MLVKLKEVFTRFEIKSKSQSPFYITTLEQKISGSSIKYSRIIFGSFIPSPQKLAWKYWSIIQIKAKMILSDDKVSFKVFYWKIRFQENHSGIFWWDNFRIFIPKNDDRNRSNYSNENFFLTQQYFDLDSLSKF